MVFQQIEQSKPLLTEDGHRDSEDSLNDLHISQPTAKRMLYKCASLIRPAHITNILKRLGYSLVAQPIRSYAWEDHAPPPKLFPTSYLNGLRGLTAVKVFTFHYMMAYTDLTHLPWGMDERHTRFLALPIIRYFWTGFTSHIFFVVAGYLTSLRIFQLLDRNDTSSQAKVLMNISGSLFRRAFRLYLPVFLITLIFATYIYLGFYEKYRPLYADRETWFPGEWNEEKPIMYATYGEQLKFWAHEMFMLTNINTEGTFYPWHDQHLWSILSEMRASVHLYGCLIALTQCKRHIRFVLLLVIAYIYYCWNHWEVWVYVLGAAVAQLDLILTERQENRNLLPEKEEAHTLRTSRLRLSKEMYQALRYTAFIIAFYLLSYPIYADRAYAPGYETLKSFIPEWVDRKDKFYSNLGSTLLLFLLVRSNPNTSKWRKFLMLPIPQYLGSISFAFYLVQAFFLHVYGYMIPQWIWMVFGTTQKDVGDMAWTFPIIIGWAISLVTILWVADVWTREVEGRCVKLVKWIEKTCFK